MTTEELIAQLQQMVNEGHGGETVIIRQRNSLIDWPKAVDHKGQNVRILTCKPGGTQ